MAYKNKTYVCFDADNDMHYYNLMRAWKENDKIAFNFYNAHDKNVVNENDSESTIKKKLSERLDNSKIMLVLIGDKTKNLYKYVRWEIDFAIKNDIPIIAVNLNKKNGHDSELCPPLLRNELVVHIPYTQKAINLALNNWPSEYAKLKLKGNKESWFYEGL